MTIYILMAAAEARIDKERVIFLLPPPHPSAIRQSVAFSAETMQARRE